MLRRTFKQSREYPAVRLFSSELSAPALTAFAFALQPRADSASSMIMIPPWRLVLAHVRSLRNSAGPWDPVQPEIEQEINKIQSDKSNLINDLVKKHLPMG